MGVIQCGIFTGSTTVSIGWEPQYITFKRVDSTGDWITIDNMRGCAVGGVDAILNSNLSGAETSSDYIDFTATGFISKGLTGNYIYTVIRRPNKPPTSGTQVYNAIARTGDDSTNRLVTTGMVVDSVFVKNSSAAVDWVVADRLRGNSNLKTNLTSAEGSSASVFTGSPFDSNVGFKVGNGLNVNNSPGTYIDHAFRRAPGVFDTVCYTGTGVAHAEAHGLGVVPELMIVKKRSSATNSSWVVYSAALGSGSILLLNTTVATQADALCWNNTTPTSTAITLGTNDFVNGAGATFVAYIFASKQGISKVFSFTGNGTSQTINCGFAAGARFVLVKRVDSTGDWYVWSSVTGIVAGNDPHLSLNTTAAEVTTDDSVDPTSEGFICNQNTATNINVNGATYIGLAIA